MKAIEFSKEGEEKIRKIAKQEIQKEKENEFDYSKKMDKRMAELENSFGKRMETEKEFLERLLEIYNDTKIKYPHCVKENIEARIKLVESGK